MPFTDLTIDALEIYRPDVAEPSDFDAFWERTIAESRAAGGDVTLVPADTAVTALIVEDFTFPGFGGEPIKAWVTRPRTDEPLPAVVEFIGYGGGRGIPGERLQWASAGYVHVLMDTRGQGAGWSAGGSTPDPHGSDSAFPGFMTRGITSPDTYYYRRVFTDGVRAVDAVRDLPFVDATRIALTGGSQGGGITLAVAALAGDVVGVMPDVPFLCHFRRSVERTPEAPFTEVQKYLAVHRNRIEDTFRTLSYFDGVNFARRITAPTLVSVALMDPIVLPSSIFAAYNHLAAADRTIEVYPFNGHEGGGIEHWTRQTAWLASRL